MPIFKSCYDEASSITHMQSLKQGSIGYITTTAEVHLFDTTTCHPLRHLKIQEFQSHYHNGTFNHDGTQFAFAHTTEKGNAIRIIDTASKTLLRSYATQHNVVELLHFDPTGRYILAGTNTGRVLLWRTDGHNLLARLCSFPEHSPSLPTTSIRNFVSAVAFHNQLIAVSGYGGSIVITNVHTQANTKRLRPGKARINVLHFLNEHRLLAGNEDGVILLLHTQERHPTQRIATGIGPIVHLALLPNEDLLLAASVYEHIALIHLDTMQVLDNRYITTHAPIDAMCMGEGYTLILGLQHGVIQKVDLSPFAEFNTLIMEQRFDDAYAIAEREPIIYESAEFTHLESHFEDAFQNAHQHFIQEERDKAVQFLSPFFKVPSKAKRIRELVTAFDNYPRLMHLVSRGKYAPAYGLCTQYPPLQQTPAFKAMEIEWERAFIKAQKQVLKGQESLAKQSLHAFLTVADKSPYIRLLLYNKTTLLAFARAIGNKDFATLNKLTNSEPILRHTPAYKVLMQDSEQLIESIMSAIKHDAFEKAELLCDILERIPHLTQHHSNIRRMIHRAKQLASLHQSHELLQLYELLDQYHELAVLPRAKHAEEDWKALISQCENAALQGNTRQIKELLGPLLLLSSRSEKVGNILRASYQMQIKYLLSKHYFDDATSALISYLDIFGMDNEVAQLIKVRDRQNAEPLTLKEAHHHFRPRALWQSTIGMGLPDSLI